MKVSSGILLYKKDEKGLKVFLAHPGGPFWKGKDEKAWDFPKGEVDNGKDGYVGEYLLNTALRELKEETGIDLSERKKGEFKDLGSIKRKDGKVIHVFALDERGEWSGLLMGSSYVELDYNGRKIKFPEVDKAGFFSILEARKKVFASLNVFLDRLEEKIK